MSAERTTSRVEVGGRTLTVSNLDKVLYPDDGFTKGQMVDYYVRVADAMLPHLEGRPLTMKRYPDGAGGTSFFEKHVPAGRAALGQDGQRPHLRRQRIGHVPGGLRPPHAGVGGQPRGHRAARAPVAGRKEAEAARPTGPVRRRPRPRNGCVDGRMLCGGGLARAVLDGHGLRAVAKTSGSKGLQLYARLDGTVSWDRSRSLARELAQELERQHPDLVVSNMRKELRPGRVLIDWSQNHPMKTTVAAYSLRGRSRPTASTPVTWEEVEACADAGDPSDLVFTATDVLERLASQGDLFTV